MAHKPRIIVSVTNDLSTDQRVNRSCLALLKQGFEVLLVGRQIPSSSPLQERTYDCHRLKLLFHKGPLFYAEYNIRLFFFLIFRHTAALYSNDLDTLPANYLVSKIKRIFLAYDSHEYYTGVPELESRPVVRKIWHTLEKWIFPSLKCIITVNDSIADLYQKEYGKKLIVIRNVPLSPFPSNTLPDKATLRKELGLPLTKKIVILQGAGINIERGAEEAVAAMQFIDDVILIILGDGDVLDILQSEVIKYHLEQKVIFKPRMPYTEMIKYTSACDLGLTLDKDTNLNYRFSLPNKIFDYINAGIPILASRLPEVEKIIKGYHVGDFIDNHNPSHIAERIQFMFSSDENIKQWQKNLQLASRELNWEEEVKKFPDIIHELN